MDIDGGRQSFHPLQQCLEGVEVSILFMTVNLIHVHYQSIESIFKAQREIEPIFNSTTQGQPLLKI